MTDLTDRNPPVRELAERFTPPGGSGLPRLDRIARACQALATLAILELPDSPQLEEGLALLLKARDYFLIAALPTR